MLGFQGGRGVGPAGGVALAGAWPEQGGLRAEEGPGREELAVGEGEREGDFHEGGE